MKICDRCKDMKKVVMVTFVNLTDESEIHLCKACGTLVTEVMYGIVAADLLLPPADEVRDVPKGGPGEARDASYMADRTNAAQLGQAKEPSPPQAEAKKIKAKGA